MNEMELDPLEFYTSMFTYLGIHTTHIENIKK